MKGEDVVQAYKYKIQLQEELAEEENSDSMADSNLLGFGIIKSAQILFEDEESSKYFDWSAYIIAMPINKFKKIFYISLFRPMNG